MTPDQERAAFVAAIAAAPRDVTTRLVYADWLQEWGEGQAAALLRRSMLFLREKAGRFEEWPGGGGLWREFMVLSDISADVCLDTFEVATVAHALGLPRCDDPHPTAAGWAVREIHYSPSDASGRVYLIHCEYRLADRPQDPAAAAEVHPAAAGDDD